MESLELTMFIFGFVRGGVVGEVERPGCGFTLWVKRGGFVDDSKLLLASGDRSLIDIIPKSDPVIVGSAFDIQLRCLLVRIAELDIQCVVVIDNRVPLSSWLYIGGVDCVVEVILYLR